MTRWLIYWCGWIENLDNDDIFKVDIDFRLYEKNKLRGGHYQIVFFHPEAFISSK